MMGGWKTWAAGIGMILAGAGKALMAWTGEPQDPAAVWEGVQLVLAGLGLIGIGHKVEKAGNGQ